MNIYVMGTDGIAKNKVDKMIELSIKKIHMGYRGAGNTPFYGYLFEINTLNELKSFVEEFHQGETIIKNTEDGLELWMVPC